MPTPISASRREELRHTYTSASGTITNGYALTATPRPSSTNAVRGRRVSSAASARIVSIVGNRSNRDQITGPISSGVSAPSATPAASRAGLTRSLASSQAATPTVTSPVASIISSNDCSNKCQLDPAIQPGIRKSSAASGGYSNLKLR